MSCGIIISATWHIVKSLGRADQQILNARGPGHCVAEISLQNPGKPRSASVRARTAVRLLEMTRDTFGSILNRQPSFAYDLARYMSRLLKVISGVSTEGRNLPINLTVEMGGAFRLDSEPIKEEFERISHIICPAIVFPYLREFVADLTIRSGMVAVTLPPTNFVEAARKRLAGEKRAKEE